MNECKPSITFSYIEPQVATCSNFWTHFFDLGSTLIREWPRCPMGVAWNSDSRFICFLCHWAFGVILDVSLPGAVSKFLRSPLPSSAILF